MKRCAIFVLMPVLVFALSCSKISSYIKQEANTPDHSGSAKAGAVNVPRNAKNSVTDENAAKESPCILTMPNANDILLGERKLTKDSLSSEVAGCLERQRPFEKVVYIKADDALEYGNIIDVVNATRKVQGDRIRFIVSPTDRTDNPKDVLEAKVPAPPKDEGKIARPNPLTLVVELTADGRIKLNNEGHDSLESVAAKLKEVFKYREDSGILREGTNEVEATVFIKAPRSIKYGEVIKAIDALKGSGANPVGLQIDDLPQYKIQ